MPIESIAPHRRRPLAALAAGLLVATTAAVVPGSAAWAEDAVDPAAASLPAPTSGERPGPEVLYAPAPDSPILTNHDPRFRAPFLTTTGAERYVDGEYLYADHLYDDHGADTDGSGGSSLSPSAGDLTYPGPRTAHNDNGADLVELRLAPSAAGLGVRITLNTLLDAATPLAFVAFDADDDDASGSSTLPADPGLTLPGTDHVLYVGGTAASWSTWDGAAWTTTPLAVEADLEANQLTTTVPVSVADPTGMWQATTGVGLADASGTDFVFPDASAPAIFNLGFRFDEAFLAANVGPDTDQAAALADDDATRFENAIDFDLLRSGGSDDRVPTTGRLIRFYPSRLALGEGRGTGVPMRIGPLVPYSLYVPTTYDGTTPAGFALNLHSLGQYHWQYNGSTGIQQIGEQRNAIVATPDGRGEDGWYQAEAEYDTFEVWNDVARHYVLDPDRAVITGYSMGGYGTYRLATLYPDLFGSAMTIVGPPGDGIWVPGAFVTGGIETLTNAWLENARNVPFLNLAGAADELVPVAGPTQQSVGPAIDDLQSFDSLGYRFRYQLFPSAEHFTIALLRYDVPQAVDFFGDGFVDRNPVHVTFSYAPAADDADLGLVHDKAYWISDVVLADPAVGAPTPEGTVDARTLAAGLAEPVSSPGVGGGVTPLPYQETNRTWAEPEVIPAENCVVLDLTNVTSFRLDAARAGLDPLADICLRATSTDQATVTVVGPEGVERDVVVEPGTDEYVLAAAPPPVVPEGQPALLLVAAVAVLAAGVGLRRRRTT